VGYRKCSVEKVVSLDAHTRIDHSYWNGKRVLVTGHTGFKGSWLTIWLNKLGCRVTGISLPPPTSPSLFNLAELDKLCDSHIIDIRDQSKLNEVFLKFQPEIVFHLAAQALVRQSYANPIETFSTNTLGTAYVLEAIRSAGSVKSAIIVTTDKVYKNSEANQPFREGDMLGGFDPYSASKAAAEIIIDSYRDSFCREKGIKLASARAGNVIGGGDWAEDRIIPDAIRAWGSNQVLKIRNPKSIRPWQHVLEPLYGYIFLGQKLEINPLFSKSYNFGPSFESATSVERVISLAQKSWVGSQVEWSIDLDSLKESTVLTLDTRLVENDLGIFPIWDICQSIDLTMNWYRSQSNGSNALKLCIDDINKFELALA